MTEGVQPGQESTSFFGGVDSAVEVTGSEVWQGHPGGEDMPDDWGFPENVDIKPHAAVVSAADRCSNSLGQI
ncbi:hypothetical protein [Rhodococcus ruber]|uniref:hypothetical protein n=1 Tax=Rhodococcus ruber TaxID=1830 RepID=UPI0005950B3C|nr:hypothetical protein [Rhodococcus ruber]